MADNLNKTNSNIYRPLFFDLKKNNDEAKLQDLRNKSAYIEIIDEIDSQLIELIKLRHPKQKLTEKELTEKIEIHLKGTPKNKYGTWVYYPWLNKLVHLLGESEFVEVRTNRNQYKITPEEELILSTKKIGIIGLSVGKAIATTIAMERICGELVLADFDLIELSNLNRIQTSVVNFNVKKTIVAAREIAEFDPYLKVTCFHEGLTENNIDDFFTGSGKLDVCIEVCDGLTTKIFARQKAKELGIPVVMNSSDRGTTDIERYDLDNDLPILHGLIDHLDINAVKQAKTNEEKIPYLLPMLGVDSSSNRLKASMLEIEETITTWPQLASGVIIGGAICTDVCRRILLDQFTSSGRYFVDIEEQINDNVTDFIEKRKLKSHKEKTSNKPLSSKIEYISELDIHINKYKSKSLILDYSLVEQIVNSATLAPSAGNNQPWYFIYKNNVLGLFKNTSYNSVLDYNGFASLFSLGAATENILIKSNSLGLKPNLNFVYEGKSNLVATFEFSELKNEEYYPYNNLSDFINLRTTNRNLSKAKNISKEIFNQLIDCVSDDSNIELKLFVDRNKIEEIKKVVQEFDKIIMTNESTHKQFMEELRWSKGEALSTKTGIDINSFDITPSEMAGLTVSKKWSVVKHLQTWGLGSAFKKMSGNLLDSSSGVGLICASNDSLKSIFKAGMAMQRVWLTATKNNLAIQPMSACTFLSKRIKNYDFNEVLHSKENIMAQYDKLKSLCEINNNDVFLFRIALADNVKIKSYRKPLNEVFSYE